MFLLGSLSHSTNFYGKRFLLFLALVLLPSPALHATVASEKAETQGSHATIELGLGGTGTVGATSSITSEPGFNVLFGMGYRVNQHLSIPFEYNFDLHGIQDAVLKQSGQPRGFIYFNSFAVNPMVAFSAGNYFGGYIVGGGGFSTKQASFGDTTYSYSNCGGSIRRKDGYACPGYNALTTKSSIQPLLDIGGGITESFHEHGRARLFLDVRYVKMFSPVGNFAGFEAAGTELIPVTVGVRF